MPAIMPGCAASQDPTSPPFPGRQRTILVKDLLENESWAGQVRRVGHPAYQSANWLPNQKTDNGETFAS